MDQKCQQLLWNLMEAVSLDTKVSAPEVIRQVMETSSCDRELSSASVRDLKTLRHTYATEIGSEAMESVMKRQQDMYTERLCLDVVIHYRMYTESVIVRAFGPLQKMEFLSYRCERTLERIGFFPKKY
jgi:hypothetical protein